jgi:hypothetical protein
LPKNPQVATDLQQINHSSLPTQPGSSFPIVTLADGRKIPTGTVGACLVNIKAYDRAHTGGDHEQLQELQTKIKAAVPVLKMAGMFDLFSPEEWMGGTSEGRKLVGRFAAEMGT